jgi:hypothetical protein
MLNELINLLLVWIIMVQFDKLFIIQIGKYFEIILNIYLGYLLYLWFKSLKAVWLNNLIKEQSKERNLLRVTYCFILNIL